MEIVPPRRGRVHLDGSRIVCQRGDRVVCSDEQAKLVTLLVKPQGRVWILSDGDPAGERFALSLLTKVSPHRFVRRVKLEQGKQPTDLTGEQLETCLMR